MNSDRKSGSDIEDAQASLRVKFAGRKRRWAGCSNIRVVSVMA